MALEEFKARIALLLDEMTRRPEDAHELQEHVREQLEELKGMGMPLPADLVELERALGAELKEGVRPRERP
jgi:F0F1-type ATP synthase membrane subunit b/b'